MLSWLHHSLELDNQLSQAVRAVCKLKEKKKNQVLHQEGKKENESIQTKYLLKGTYLCVSHWHENQSEWEKNKV